MSETKTKIQGRKPKTSKLAIASMLLALVPTVLISLVIVYSLLVKPIFLYRRFWVLVWILGPLMLSIFGLAIGIGAIGKISNSKGLLKGTGLAIAGIIIAACMILFNSFLLIRFMYPTHQKKFYHFPCSGNLSGLGKAMLIYACGHDDKYPTPDKWCDLLIKYAEVTEKEFVCPSAGEGRCHYAINPNASAVTSPDMVVLFETKGGWNQFGGPEILTFENHKGKGCNVLFNDLHVRFVKKEQLSELKWEAEEEQNSDLGNFRRPANDEELEYWLKNMVCYHRFTDNEVAAATGLTEKEIIAAKENFNIRTDNRPEREKDAPLLVLPYPGGRHPRIGFLEGAIDPQRETKFSVFTPWDANSYVVVDVPEAIWSNLGLTYLAHTHIDTIWTIQGIELPKLEWNRRSDGTLDTERKLPNGIAFGVKVKPTKEAVRMELWLKNGTNKKLSDLRIQNCVMTKMAAGFEQQTNDNKVLTNPYVACRDIDGKQWIITAWTNCSNPWGNDKCPCFHSDPKFPDLEPGQTHRLHGWLSFYEGTDIKAEFNRIKATGWREK